MQCAGWVFVYVQCNDGAGFTAETLLVSKSIWLAFKAFREQDASMAPRERDFDKSEDGQSQARAQRVISEIAPPICPQRKIRNLLADPNPNPINHFNRFVYNQLSQMFPRHPSPSHPPSPNCGSSD